MLFARKRPLYPFVFLRSCLCYCFFQLSASRPAPCCSLRLLSLLPINSFHLTTLDPCRAHEVLAKTSARHTSAEFVDFLAKIVESQPPGHKIHVIADNLSAHKTKKVLAFLEAHPAVRIHYTPTYSS